MKVAVTATDTTLESSVDTRFGRCPYLLIVEIDDLSFEALANPNVNNDSGAGIQTAQLIAEKGARFVLTGNCGPNAYQTLTAAGLGVIVGCSGSVRDAIEDFGAGRYRPAAQPNVAGHFGSVSAAGMPGNPQAIPDSAPGTDTWLGRARRWETGMGQGRGGGMGMGRGCGGGMGRGGGRGMGRGGGRGMGRGGGRGMGQGGIQAGSASTQLPQPGPPPESGSDEEIAALEAQARAVGERLTALNERMAQVGQEATGARLVAMVDGDQCGGCGLCAQICPTGAITMETVARVEASKCTGCGECVAQCPEEALVLKKARRER